MVGGKTSRSTGSPRLKVGAIPPSLQSATSMPTQTQKRVRRRVPARRRVHSTEPPEPPLSNPEDGSEHLAFRQWTALWQSVIRRNRANRTARRQRKQTKQK